MVMPCRDRHVPISCLNNSLLNFPCKYWRRDQFFQKAKIRFVYHSSIVKYLEPTSGEGKNLEIAWSKHHAPHGDLLTVAPDIRHSSAINLYMWDCLQLQCPHGLGRRTQRFGETVRVLIQASLFLLWFCAQKGCLEICCVISFCAMWHLDFMFQNKEWRQVKGPTSSLLETRCWRKLRANFPKRTNGEPETLKPSGKKSRLTKVHYFRLFVCKPPLPARPQAVASSITLGKNTCRDDSRSRFFEICMRGEDPGVSFLPSVGSWITSSPSSLWRPSVVVKDSLHFFSHWGQTNVWVLRVLQSYGCNLPRQLYPFCDWTLTNIICVSRVEMSNGWCFHPEVLESAQIRLRQGVRSHLQLLHNSSQK